MIHNRICKVLVLILVLPVISLSGQSDEPLGPNSQLILKHLENNPDSAISLINEDLTWARNRNDRSYEAWLELHKGLLFMFSNNNREATNQIFRSIKLYEELKDTQGLAKGYLNYGNVTFKRDTSRFMYYAKSLYYYRQVRDTLGVNRAMNNIGMYFLDNGQIDSARYYLERSLRLAQDLSNTQHIATTLVNIAFLKYKGDKDTLGAIKIVKDILKLPGIDSVTRSKVQAIHMLSQLHFNHKDLDSARPYIERVLNLTEESYFFIRSQALLMLSTIYQLEGEFRKAMHARTEADSIRMYIIRNDNKNLINLLESEHELKLNKERVLKLDAQVQKAFYVKLFLSILLVSALLIGGYISYLLKSRAEKDRAMLKAREEKAETEQRLLQSELNFTKSELTSYTANFIQHNNIIHELHQQIDEIRRGIKSSEKNQELRKLSIRLNQVINRDDARKVLLEKAMEVNNELFFELKRKYPELTEKDLHLISFIKLGLTSKEIADIYNIETQSVHTRRYRLRKRLGLDSDESLDDLIQNGTP